MEQGIPAPSVSSPYNIKHQVHVDFNSDNGYRVTSPLRLFLLKRRLAMEMIKMMPHLRGCRKNGKLFLRASFPRMKFWKTPTSFWTSLSSPTIRTRRLKRRQRLLKRPCLQKKPSR